MKKTFLLTVLLAPIIAYADDFERRASQTPLYAATERGDHAEMARLIKAGANVNEHNVVEDINWPGTGEWDYEWAHRTALFPAIERGDMKAVDLLLESGADPNVTGNIYSGSLYPLLSALNKPEIFDKLLAHGAWKGFDVDLDFHKERVVYSGEKHGALYYLARTGDEFVPRLLHLLVNREELVKKGLLAEDKELFSKMLYAAVSQPKQIPSRALVAKLVEYGADVNWNKAVEERPFAVIYHLQSPLHELALKNDVELIRFLMKHGANPHQKNKVGKSPLDVAREFGLQQAIDALEGR